MGEPIICDTSIWLYSGRIKQTHLLPKLYSSIYTTETVCWELDNGRLLRSDIPDPRQFPWVHIVQPEPHTISLLPVNRLGPGERSVLAYAQTHKLHVVGLDDRQARHLARQLGLHVVGTIGLLLQAKDAGFVLAVRPLLEQLSQAGFYISDELFAYALTKAKEK